jgi:cytochrome c-type biogenesis protein CcmH
MYIFVLIILSVVAILFVLVPYLRAKEPEGSITPDIDVYKAQLKELNNDLKSGIIDDEEATRTKLEIERRILKAADGQLISSTLEKPNNFLSLAIVVIILFSAAFYAVIGTPGMPDFPIEEFRQQEMPMDRVEALAQTDDLIAKVKARLASSPEEVQGWGYLANLEMNKGNFQKAAEALYQAHIIAPDVFDYQLMYAESLIMASNERVTPAALIILNKAKKMAPEHPGPRYYLGLADFQAGDVGVAHSEWKVIQGELENSDPMMPLLNVWINRAEVALGIAEPLPQTRAPSITAEQAETIQSMSADEQQELIRQMVLQLATKQEENPTNIEGWTRLSRAYMVLGEKVDAIAAMNAAIDNAPDSQKGALQKELENLMNIE